MPCSPWPRHRLVALCVLGGQHPPGRVRRNQPHVPWTPATGQDPGGTRARASPPASRSPLSGGRAPVQPSRRLRQTPSLSDAGSSGERLLSCSPSVWVARGVDAGSPSDASHGLRGRTPQAPESLLKGPLEAWEERGSGHTVLNHVSGEPWVDSPRPPALQGWFSRASPLLSSAGQPPPEPHVRQGAGPRGALTLLWLPTLAPWSPGSPGLPASPM